MAPENWNEMWLFLPLAGFVIRWGWLRLCLSRAKAPGLAGHVRWAKRFSRWIPPVRLDLDAALQADKAPPHWVEIRRRALTDLQSALHSPKQSLAMTKALSAYLPDLLLINAYRVPFQFQAMTHSLPISSVWSASEGNRLFDLDRKAYWDLTGSYGVNVLGTDFYKANIRQAEFSVAELGPVLGSYHPMMVENVEMLCRISGQEMVTFHMSGTEAVMQAVRMARYHTGNSKIVRFAGAYHGWWDDVQPGPGNPSQPSADTLTLREMHPMSLRVLEQRRDVACVLINPIQVMHPNRAAPGDSTLIANGRQVNLDPQAYRRWLHQLRDLCTRKGIALIIDEVFLGFRVAHGGVQSAYGVQADLVTYGKTLGGGLPIGVVCGAKRWMQRFNPDRPGDICFARGTFMAHPYVMATMNGFLKHWLSPTCQTLVERAPEVWAARLAHVNRRLVQAGMPIRFAGLHTVWTLIYEVPSRYNWMLQFYFRKHGLALSWVGTGRFIFNLSYTDDEFEQVVQAILSACHDMNRGGWWMVREGVTSHQVGRMVACEMLVHLMRRK